jgi:hypothetical protein
MTGTKPGGGGRTPSIAGANLRPLEQIFVRWSKSSFAGANLRSLEQIFVRWSKSSFAGGRQLFQIPIFKRRWKSLTLAADLPLQTARLQPLARIFVCWRESSFKDFRQQTKICGSGSRTLSAVAEIPLPRLTPGRRPGSSSRAADFELCPQPGVFDSRRRTSAEDTELRSSSSTSSRWPAASAPVSRQSAEFPISRRSRLAFVPATQLSRQIPNVPFQISIRRRRFQPAAADRRLVFPPPLYGSKSAARQSTSSLIS